MTSNSRHGLPPRLMAHQPTRFATAQESKPSPSPGIRIILGFSDRSESDSLVASRRFAMRPGIALRPDYDAARLRGLAKAARDAGQSRRLLALAEIYDGGSRTRAARVGGVGLQTLRDWVVRFNAHGPGGLIDGKAPGNARKLNESQRQALVNIVERGPMPAIHGVVRWRLKDLTLWIWEEFQISLSETTLSRELRALGYRKLSARPRHYAQKPEALEFFKKPSRPPWKRCALEALSLRLVLLIPPHRRLRHTCPSTSSHRRQPHARRPLMRRRPELDNFRPWRSTPTRSAPSCWPAPR